MFLPSRPLGVLAATKREMYGTWLRSARVHGGAGAGGGHRANDFPFELGCGGSTYKRSAAPRATEWSTTKTKYRRGEAQRARGRESRGI